jgi:hypothetical protein
MCTSGDSTKKNASSHCSCEALGKMLCCLRAASLRWPEMSNSIAPHAR